MLGPVLTIIGAITVAMAIRAYPHSNLLGGWGFILGPIYWLGLLLCLVAVVGWIIVGLRAMIHKLTPPPKKNSNKLDHEKQSY